jgi:hypothetical protein
MVLGLSKMNWMEELRVGNGDDFFLIVCNFHVMCMCGVSRFEIYKKKGRNHIVDFQNFAKGE